MKNSLLVFISILLICSGQMWGQGVRKPSAMRATREDLAQKPTTNNNSVLKITSQAEFDDLARVYHQGTPYALPHVMFLIDRRNKNRIYYINSKKYRFHKDFANATYLSLERGQAFTQSNYYDDKRRFILGTLAWQTPIKKWTFEFWEGDLIGPDLIKTTSGVINQSFYESVSFKPNSIRQDDLSANLQIERVSADEINRGQEYLVLNEARGVGRIHIIDKLDDTVDIGYNEIIVLKEVPISLPPVAGLIIAAPSTPLSHINLLAKGWNIPNAYIKNADQLFKQYDGRWIEFETKLTDYTIKPATKEILDERAKREKELDRVVKSPPSNLKIIRLASLREQRKTDITAYGGKSANLGEIINARLPGIYVPDGFSIPFYYYAKFMAANGFDVKIEGLLDDNDFVHNPSVRRKKLEELRAEIQGGKFDDKLRDVVINRWRSELGGKQVYARSSSNSEDLPNFSGAGLYYSAKNVVDEEQLIEGVKKVWASLWNFEAYEARERNFIDHTGVYMAVLIQTGVPMDNGGVMITQDPFDKTNKGAVYISATFGHNLPVTGGDGEVKQKVIPEQILFTPKSNSVQVLTRSDQDVMFIADPTGGLKSVPFTNDRRVLTNLTSRSLVKAAQNIKRVFGGKEQDIEWAYLKGRMYILQARPYIDGK